MHTHLVEGDGDAQLGAEAHALRKDGEAAARSEELAPAGPEGGDGGEDDDDDDDAVRDGSAARHAACSGGVEKVRSRLEAERTVGTGEAAVGCAGGIAQRDVDGGVRGGAAHARILVRAELDVGGVVAGAPRTRIDADGAQAGARLVARRAGGTGVADERLERRRVKVRLAQAVVI